MHEFSVFRQERHDGGVRSGITLDGEMCWHQVREGSAEEDPALRWYFDVRGEGEAVPGDPLELYHWLRGEEMTSLIRANVLALADRVAIGIDQGSWPLRHEISDAPPGVRLQIVTSATHRMDSLSISDVVRRFADDWLAMLDQVELAALTA
jgi:hypothetical protein